MNVESALLQAPQLAFSDSPHISNLACHNYLGRAPPPGVSKFLGLGLNFCLRTPKIVTSSKSFPRFKNDVRRMYALRDSERDPDSYIPGMYHPSHTIFKEAAEDIELGLKRFETGFLSLQAANARLTSVVPNITKRQHNLMQTCRRHDKYIYIESDKGLGPVQYWRLKYAERVCSEHLGNTTNYQQLPAANAKGMQLGLHRYKFPAWLSKYYYEPNSRPPRNGEVAISKAEKVFLLRALKKYPDKFARFRMSMKIHKTPFKFRPLVCCAGTFMNDWSRWLDYQLQKLKPHIESYLRDGNQLLEELKDIQLHPNDRVFTCDANSMYNNIDTKHAIEVITWLLDELKPRMDIDFPINAIKDAMVLIMTNNLFEWGALYFLQLIGTAMGTSAAVMWATLYYYYHERVLLLPKYKTTHLRYYKRFIDNMFGIWRWDGITAWNEFCNDVDNFGVLTWDIRNQDRTPSHQVNFLDITISIKNRKIETRTFQKELNLYLYLPPTSSHSPGCIKGTIYSLVGRYFTQNTHREDYVHFVRLLFRRLLARGWDPDVIKPLILEACARMEAKANTPEPEVSEPHGREEIPLFFHLQHHDNDIKPRQIQQLYEEHLGPILKEHLEIERPIIAYSRPPNIGDYVTQAKWHKASEKTSTVIMGEFKQGLAP